MEKEELFRKITDYMEESLDENFDRYLAYMRSELEKPQADVAEIQKSLEQKIKMYRRNQQTMQQEQAEEPPEKLQQLEVPQDSGQRREPTLTGEAAYSQYQGQKVPQPVEQPQVKQRENEIEFKIGIWVLSMIGVVFIMAALVILGKEFLSTFVQGMLLFIVSLFVLLVSELGLRKRLPQFSLVLSGLGVSCLYLATLINYLYLETLPSWMALIIAVLTAVSALEIGHSRESSVICIISIVGIYFCMLPYKGELSNVQFLVFGIIILLVNGMCLFLNTSSGRMAAELVQILCIGFYTPILILLGKFAHVSQVILSLYSLACLIMMIGIFLRMEKKAPQLTLWAIFTVLQGFIVGMGYRGWFGVCMTLALALVCAGGCFLAREKKGNWVLYYVLSGCFLLSIPKLPWEQIERPFHMAILLGICLLFQLCQQLHMPKKGVLTWITLGLLGMYSLGFLSEREYPFLILALLLGIAAIWILVRERFGAPDKARGVILAGYLTYGVLCLKLKTGIVISILLMVVAVAAISIGFWKKEKMIRIYGLCLALFCCLKCAIWDFWAESIFYRMLVFLVVGILALLISLIYMLLEKNMKKTKESAENIET